MKTPTICYSRVIHVIETTLHKEGSGLSESDPVRIVTQYWTLDGYLLFEIDPLRRETQTTDVANP